jgi:hypothetical protein|tara:strand:- start:604 stop:765 length:162 start_codon:yes stop_codon:yes gene_type:complete
MNHYNKLRSLLEVRGTQSREMKRVGAIGKESKRLEAMKVLMGELRDRPKKKKT